MPKPTLPGRRSWLSERFGERLGQQGPVSPLSNVPYEGIKGTPANTSMPDIPVTVSAPPVKRRGRGATFSGGTPPALDPNFLADISKRGSTSLLENDRLIVESGAETATCPVVVRKAEDIDAVVMTGRGARRKKPTEVLAGARSHDGDIDEFCESRTSEADSETPDQRGPVSTVGRLANTGSNRPSLVERLTQSMRRDPGHPATHSTGDLTENANMLASKGSLYQSNLSFAELFPSKALSGLSAPVPFVPSESLPESYFPQTLAGIASEDIDELTDIGITNSPNRLKRAPGTTRRKSSVKQGRALDLDKLVGLAEGKLVIVHEGSVMSDEIIVIEGKQDDRLLSPDDDSAGRDHLAVALKEEQTDIDDILSLDPNPLELVATTLPKTFGDADDFCIVEHEDVEASLRKSVSNLMEGLGPRSRSKGSLLSLSTKGGRPSTGIMPTFKPYSPQPPHTTPATPDNDLRPIMNDANCSEDIEGLIDIGHKSHTSLESMVAVPTSPTEPHGLDIGMLCEVGGTTRESFATATSSQQADESSTTKVTTETVQPGRKQSKQAPGSPRARVSYIHTHRNLQSRVSTDPGAFPPATSAGSLDIDQFVAGEAPTDWRGKRRSNSKSLEVLNTPPQSPTILQTRQLTELTKQARRSARPRSQSEPFRPSVPSPLQVQVHLNELHDAGPPAQRRLTSLDINHFMGIADTIDADTDPPTVVLAESSGVGAYRRAASLNALGAMETGGYVSIAPPAGASAEPAAAVKPPGRSLSYLFSPSQPRPRAPTLSIVDLSMPKVDIDKLVSPRGMACGRCFNIHSNPVLGCMGWAIDFGHSAKVLVEKLE
ncbi:hypothetical protein BC832DRAFT_432487 [Gaertneriomyces semiglobifer]|nr:hypothetical protein BC832DRAFT_432487 [Gaertneriomyces semiglobifer]